MTLRRRGALADTEPPPRMSCTPETIPYTALKARCPTQIWHVDTAMEGNTMSKELAKEREIMRMHAVRGKILREFVIPAKEYAGLTMKEGQTLRCVDIEGKQVPDVVCFNERDLSEELNLGNSL